ncbi:MAG: PulJ/GspJ family protein [Planctomycetota bacterium]|jgi:type II secretory pathway pseudopilin PulG
MKTRRKNLRSKFGFSLAEVIATLTMGSIILVVVLGIYNQASQSAAAVTEKLNSSNLSSEVLQRIAEDLDNIIATNSDIIITTENKFEQGYPSSRMTIEKSFYDDKNQEQILEKIIWQSSYDFESLVPGLVIYRSHGGLSPEDKLLDNQKEIWERELFIPICDGVTFFKFQAIKYNRVYETWASQELPNAIVATISFAEPFEALDGTLDVFEEDKTTRTIVIDRIRRIGFTYVSQYNLNLTEDVNEVNEMPENMQDANNINQNSVMEIQS